MPEGKVKIKFGNEMVTFILKKSGSIVKSILPEVCGERGKLFYQFYKILDLDFKRFTGVLI